MQKGLLLTVVALGAATIGYATEPNGYYSTCENKNGAELLTALCGTVSSHTNVGYKGVWDGFKTSDVDENGKIIDIYSTKRWTVGTEQCGNYKTMGDCYNREHSFPKSWFNYGTTKDQTTPMHNDLFHLYPTDGYVNSKRSNGPYGECANGTTLPSVNGINALGRTGTSTFEGYTGEVYEPDDEYKGDLARSYFYMAATYNEQFPEWSGDMLAGNSYPAFSDWAVNLLLKWHRQDPVSDKELARQEAIYAIQGNRNPFIDHPEMAEYIWGDKKDSKWSNSVSYDPVISLPVNNTTVDLGVVGVGVAREFSVEVKGTALTESVKVSVSGNGFAVSPATLTATAANATKGAMVTVTVTAATAGVQTGTLTVTSGTAKSVVTLTVTAYDGLPASAPTNITSESFVAHWTYVGSADSNGNYKLVVTDADGEVVDTYPRDVTATDEQCTVDELEPETTYKYYITNGTLKSNEITVTTGALQPSVELYYDGDLYLKGGIDEPSEAAELLVEVENVDTDITLTVNAPFQLSSDKSNWATTLTIKPSEDRVYVRIFGSTEGTYQSGIVVTAGTYTNDQATVSGKISNDPKFFEDFETGKTGNYTTATSQCTAAVWAFSNAGVYEAAAEAYDGNNYVRFGNNSDSYVAMDEDKTDGVGTVTLYAAGWSSKDGASAFDLQYSTDGGETWETAGTVNIEAPGSTVTYAPYTFTVNKAGNVRIKVQQTSGKRMRVDNVTITDYKESNGIDGVTSDYKSWDAYCRGGVLCVELAEAETVKVYGMDGIAYHNGVMGAGTTQLTLAPGLYVVVVNDFTRRVLVK